MVIFSVGSLLCALAPTIASLTGVAGIDWLIGARAFQAIGAASLNPVSLAIIMAVFPGERRGYRHLGRAVGYRRCDRSGSWWLPGTELRLALDFLRKFTVLHHRPFHGRDVCPRDSRAWRQQAHR